MLAKRNEGQKFNKNKFISAQSQFHWLTLPLPATTSIQSKNKFNNTLLTSTHQREAKNIKTRNRKQKKTSNSSKKTKINPFIQLNPHITLNHPPSLNPENNLNTGTKRKLHPTGT